MTSILSKQKVSFKFMVSFLLVSSSVLLPEIIHLALGASGGKQFLPMYLPVLLGGCLMGMRWGVCVAMVSPIVSFAFTSLIGLTPMPAEAMLPTMTIELVVFALAAGLWSKKIVENTYMVVPAVLTAQVVSRGLYVLMAAFDGNLMGGLMQVKTSFPGIALQWLIVPILVSVIKSRMDD